MCRIVSWCRPFFVATIVAVALTNAGGLRLGQAAAPAAAAPAVTCQQAGYQNVSRADGSHFDSLVACLSYVAQGGTLVLLPDLVLHTTCDSSGLPQRVACSFTATNAGPAALVTTFDRPVVFQGQLAVLAGLDTEVDAEVIGHCPLNVSSIRQVSTNNFVFIEQIGVLNIADTEQFARLAPGGFETVDIACGGGTFGVGQSISFSVTLGGGAPIREPVVIGATLDPDNLFNEVTRRNNSALRLFLVPRPFR